MPHKVNPINFHNSEGNLGLSRITDFILVTSSCKGISPTLLSSATLVLDLAIQCLLTRALRREFRSFR
ncbi:hypothetical protein M758_10G134700 [Ceratodon purpureus]|nr:hypothetical protein M758_10G134700 [Ceratodon purpureus]